MLALLESGRLPGEVETHEGAALFVLGGFQIDRVIGATRAPWTFGFPYYHLNKQGALERKGSFRTGRPLTTFLRELFVLVKKESNFLKWINLDLPPKLSKQDMLLTCKIIGRAKEKYEQQFKGRFCVVMHPLREYQQYKEELKGLLEKEGVEVLDPPVEDRPEGKYTIPGDGHPNAALNGFLSAKLARDLG
jgi:hypothetical protein